MIEHDNLDMVTGLPMYDCFLINTRTEINNNFSQKKFVLVSTDISNFKYINRIYGYEKANELLLSLAQILTDKENNNIISCRTHSDHMISLFSYNNSEKDFLDRLENLSRLFVKHNTGKFPSIALHLNNGIYFIENPDEDLNYSIDKANVARRASKGNYRINSVKYSEDMLGKKESDARVLAAFDSAMRNNRIIILLQPKIDVITKKIVGAEALSRMYDENGKMIYPDIFIPVLENSGKVVELDRYVMNKIFATIKSWLSNGNRTVPVSINLSRMHFYEKNVADKIYKIFSKYDISTDLIEFEVTESLFFSEMDAIRTEVSKLRAYGFKVSMDDFGVGYSTLNSLGELPVDVIKFDKGFVKSSMNNNSSYQILQSLISVFKKINYDVICEGVETSEDEKMIFECGCDVVQGFLYDKPLELNDFEKKYLQESSK